MTPTASAAATQEKAPREQDARLSPAGEWLALSSDQSGRDQVYVQPFPGPGGKWLVSQGGGFNAIWSRDGIAQERRGHALGAALLQAGRFAEAESVFREDTW